ncbi:MAG: arylamine N-acetyltransferase [Acidimicrobiales bacterium]
MDVHAYLERIAFPGVPATDLSSLAALQRAHLGSVPFENLHVFHHREVRVDTAWSVSTVLSGRGGWCFELNGAFSSLLSEIGFAVDRVSASVLLGGGSTQGPDHLALIVHLDQPYLVDVGFGASFTRPIAIDSQEEVSEEHGSYRVHALGDGQYLLRFCGTDESEFSDLYRFDTAPVALSAFSKRSHYLANEPALKWSQSPFATRLIPGGRVTLLRDRIKLRRGGEEVVSPGLVDDQRSFFWVFKASAVMTALARTGAVSSSVRR